MRRIVELALVPLAVLTVSTFASQASAQGGQRPGTPPLGHDPEGQAAEAAPIDSPNAETEATRRTDEAGGSSTASGGNAALEVRAQQLEALVAGTLDPAVNERTLLRFDALALSPALSELIAGLAGDRRQAPDANDEPTTSRAEEADAPEGDGRARDRADQGPVLEGPEARLHAALVQLSELSPQKRGAMLQRQAERRAELEASRTAEVRRERALVDMRTRTGQLRAFMNGELDVSIDPQNLLQLDLWNWSAFRAAPPTAAPAETAEPEAHPPKKPKRRPGRRRRRPRAVVPKPEQEKTERAAQVEPTPDPEWEQVQSELIAARLALLSLSPEARVQLLETHRQRQQIAEADEAEAARQAADKAAQSAQAAAEARKRALRAAEQARTATQRAIAAEHARLLGVQEAQALFEAALSQQHAAVQQRREVPARWRLKVRALEQRSVLEGPRSVEADRVYRGLVEDLQGVREHLKEALRKLEGGAKPAPSIGDRDVPEDTGTPMLTELREQLSERAQQLEEVQHAQAWHETEALHSDMLALNGARLQLMAWLSPSVRAQFTGAGPEAVRQAYAEVQQITLTLRMKALTLPRTARRLKADLATAPVQVFFGLLQFLIIVAVFRRWRRGANELLGGLRRHMLAITPPTSYSERTAHVLWYVMRVRKPLEILLVVALITGLFGETGQAMGLDYVWVVVAWWVTGSTAINLLDAMATRQHLRAGGSESAELRIRSLRLVGLVIVGTGMLLSLFELGVGRGTVYEWVWEGCWLLSIPTLTLLTHWWRSTIFDRMRRRTEKTPLVEWIRAETSGMRSYFRAAIGGAYLLGGGVADWVVGRAGEWELSRRLLAYLFRTEAARQAEARGDSNYGMPLDSGRSRSFHPETSTLPIIDDAATKTVAELIEEIEVRACTLAVISGDRGAGKTITLGRIADHFGKDALVLQCPSTGLGGLLALMRTELGLEARASDEQIVAAINKRQPAVVTIDDLQRVIRPAIGGLADLDRLVYMARNTHVNISWVVAISTPAWSYVERARSERIAFDRVLNLRGWSEEQIAQLLRRSSEHAGVRPTFDGLVVARQLEDADEETAGRAERGYYRILWDYSGGNPGVAMYWWQQSLYQDEVGEVSVRLFRPPDPWDLETVPLNVRFALRTILQLDWAHPRQLAESLEMAPAVVDEALRFAQGRGYIERDGERVRITWHWLRAITVALKRQHLIAA